MQDALKELAALPEAKQLKEYCQRTKLDFVCSPEWSLRRDFDGHLKTCETHRALVFDKDGFRCKDLIKRICWVSNSGFVVHDMNEAQQTILTETGFFFGHRRRPERFDIESLIRLGCDRLSVIHALFEGAQSAIK